MAAELSQRDKIGLRRKPLGSPRAVGRNTSLEKKPSDTKQGKQSLVIPSGPPSLVNKAASPRPATVAATEKPAGQNTAGQKQIEKPQAQPAENPGEKPVEQAKESDGNQEKDGA